MLLLIFPLCIISTLLYCCIRLATPYDKMVDDEEQLKFIRDFMA